MYKAKSSLTVIVLASSANFWKFIYKNNGLIEVLCCTKVMGKISVSIACRIYKSNTNFMARA